MTQKQTCYILLFTLVFGLGLETPAHADAIQSGVDWLVQLLTSGIARGVAIIACAAMGYLAWAGMLT